MNELRYVRNVVSRTVFPASEISLFSVTTEIFPPWVQDGGLVPPEDVNVVGPVALGDGGLLPARPHPGPVHLPPGLHTVGTVQTTVYNLYVH